MELTRGKITETIGNILLGPISSNPAFHQLCKKHGATTLIVPINSEITTSQTIVQISGKVAKKKLQELEKNENVIGYCADEENITQITETKKPIIGWETNKGNMLATKDPKKGTLLITENKTPEEINQLVKDSGIAGVIIISTENPVIFEQYTNYTEKGYYNKVTKKRREKLAKEFQDISNKLGTPDQDLYNILLGN